RRAGGGTRPDVASAPTRPSSTGGVPPAATAIAADRPASANGPGRMRATLSAERIGIGGMKPSEQILRPWTVPGPEVGASTESRRLRTRIRTEYGWAFGMEDLAWVAEHAAASGRPPPTRRDLRERASAGRFGLGLLY